VLKAFYVPKALCALKALFTLKALFELKALRAPKAPAQLGRGSPGFVGWVSGNPMKARTWVIAVMAAIGSLG